MGSLAMALSAAARDILTIIGEDCAVYMDSDHEIVIDVANKRLVPGSVLSKAIELLASKGMSKMHCSVDFQNDQITFKSGTCIIDMPLTLDPGKDPETESEKAAVAIVRSMGVIDLDNLLPECCIESSNGVTCVKFSRLLHVSHDAIVHYLHQHIEPDVVYDMDRHVVCVTLPRVQKRKR